MNKLLILLALTMSISSSFAQSGSRGRACGSASDFLKRANDLGTALAMDAGLSKENVRLRQLRNQIDSLEVVVGTSIYHVNFQNQQPCAVQKIEYQGDVRDV